MISEDLLQLYASSFRENWNLTALTDYVTGENLTYADLARRIARTHIFFELCGVKPGDKVALLGRNSVSWVVSYMATLTYGAVVVPILPEFNPQDAQHIINHSDSVMLFAGDHLWEHLDFEHLDKIKVAMSLDNQQLLGHHLSGKDKMDKITASLHKAFNRRYPHGFGPENVAYGTFPKDAIAEINYTSGTTGFSKGVMLTLNNLCGNVVFGMKTKLHYPGSRCLGFLPLAHAYGCAFDMLLPLATGSHITVFGKIPTPKLLIKALQQVKPTIILCVPLILEKIYKKQLLPIISKPSVRRLMSIPFLRQRVYSKIRAKLSEAFGGEFQQIVVGGAALNPDVEAFLMKIRFPISVGYGMTECGPLISFTPWRRFIPGSSGRTLPGIMYSKVLSDNEAYIPGEICVKGENVMKGYYKNPKATAEVLDNDGWLHTGDMGTIADAGTIFIKGRYKTMLLSGSGQNIYPEEIESKLNNLPYVGESLVVQRGNKLVALVYPDFEAMDKSKLTSDMMPQIMEKVRAQLNTLTAPYERIDEIQLRANEFEKTPKRSIKRYLYQ
ncbi:MAG: AMP-binding protein [Firmicutes bacterium]|nr:AMP-binding protein [Bacillota bacterium]MCM1402104.1 AMP-binding protein [Bacteroides sp.]MCM1478013.1 AMP-binding protein [Bacteroides sp.]